MISLENWQEPGSVGWSFQHLDDLFPTAAIGGSASVEGGRPIELAVARRPLGGLAIALPDGTTTTVDDVLGSTNTDGWLVLHGREIVAEGYFGAMDASTRHLLMSVSKSVVSSVLGVLVGQGVIDPEALVTDYVPELAASGYAGATVRNLLDMRSGIRFSEEYLDADAEVRRLDEAVGFAPKREGSARSLKAFLPTLEQARPHGGAFEYRSCETDVLGWVIEAASGRRFAELATELVWSRLGTTDDAFIVVDSEGTGMFDGGICATVGGLARFGAMIRDGGVSLTGDRVLPADWVDDLFAGAPDSAEAFAVGPSGMGFPGGRYRSQFWFPSPSADVALCLGIHGQMIFIDRATGVVGVKFSAWPLPLEDDKGQATLAMFRAISAHLAG